MTDNLTEATGHMTPEWAEAQRPGFEAWFKTTEHYYPALLDRKITKPTEYKYLTVQCAWEGYIAAKADTLTVTEEMVARAFVPYCCPGKYGCIQPKACTARLPSVAVPIKREITAILSAALNPIGTEGEEK